MPDNDEPTTDDELRRLTRALFGRDTDTANDDTPRQARPQANRPVRPTHRKGIRVNLTESAHIRQIVAAAAATGTKLPSAVVTAVERAARLAAAVRSVDPPETALYEAIAAAVENGIDPAADLGVQRVLAGRAIATEGVIRGTDQVGVTATTAAVFEARDDVVQAWRKPYDAAVAALHQAHGVLGSVDLDDAAAILPMGANAADAWASARKAVAMIRAVADGWVALAGLCRVTLDPARAVLRIATVEPERWAGLDTRKADSWAALAAGLELTLPTLREYVDRCKALDEYLSTPVTAIDTQRSSVAGHEIRVPVA